MRTTRPVALATVVVLLWSVGLADATHDPDVTDREAKCQILASRNVGRFLGDKFRCLDKCQKRAFDDPAALVDCRPPYGSATFGCIQSSESEWAGKIRSACAQDCPECYAGGDCKVAAAERIAEGEARVETLAPAIHCDDSTSGDGLTDAEFKCQRSVARYVAKFEAKKMRCLEKCRQAEHAGKLPVGSCDPPVTEPKTAECIARAAGRSEDRIDRRCESSLSASADKPECYGGTDGATWIASAGLQVDTGDAGFYCGD